MRSGIDFRITGLAPEPFRRLFDPSDETQAEHGVLRGVVDEKHGSPDRMDMREAETGDAVLVLDHVSHGASSADRRTQAILGRGNACEVHDRVNVIPEAMRHRLLSLRGFDAKGMLREVDVVNGRHVEAVIQRLLANPEVASVEIHDARAGCYSCRIERA